MLARLKRANRGRRVLIWAMALALAVAPAVSMAFAAPAGAYASVLVHIHEHDEDGHVHYGEHDNHHPDDGMSDEQQDGQGQSRVHVHYDVGCPSVLLPVLSTGTLEHRESGRIAPLPAEVMRAAPSGRLLRPPISLLRF